MMRALAAFVMIAFVISLSGRAASDNRPPITTISVDGRRIQYESGALKSQRSSDYGRMLPSSNKIMINGVRIRLPGSDIDAQTDVDVPETDPIAPAVMDPVVVANAVAPGTTPIEPQVIPSTTPIEPQVTPSTTPIEPQVIPSTTPIEPQVIPFTTAIEPQVIPFTTPIEPQVIPFTTSIEPQVIPFTTPIEPQVPSPALLLQQPIIDMNRSIINGTN